MSAQQHDERWHKLLTEGHRPLRIAHFVFRYMPGPPRCKVCHNPFGGIGGKLLAVAGYSRSRKNPQLCARCCDALPPGGAEVDIAVLFADVRGSTALAEQIGASAFAAVLNQFYHTATEVLVRHNAIIDKLIGDEVMALFIPGICGTDYCHRAAQAAIALLARIGSARPGAPSIPIGGAVTSGSAYVGNVGSDNVLDFTALGDTVNTAARLASRAAAGELLLSETVYAAVAKEFPDVERRVLNLRGKDAPVPACVLRPADTGPFTKNA
jgi:adenylate cyclase